MGKGGMMTEGEGGMMRVGLDEMDDRKQWVREILSTITFHQTDNKICVSSLTETSK